MPPALLLVRLGRVDRFFLPLPVFLFWPLWILAWMVLGLVWLATSGRPRPGGLIAGLVALRLCGELRGTRVGFRRRERFFTLQFV